MSCALGQVEADEVCERVGAKQQRAEILAAWQIVLHTIARRGFFRHCPLQLGIDDRYIASGLGIREVEVRAGQPLIEKPDAPCVTAGRLLANERLDRSGAGFQKQTFQDGEVEAFVFEGEG
jgi:hypothetical protein